MGQLFHFEPTLQVLLMLGLMTFINWISITQVPFYHKFVNCIYCGLHAVVLGANALLSIMVFRRNDGDAYQRYKDYTQYVLYGALPAFLLGGLLSFGWQVRHSGSQQLRRHVPALPRAGYATAPASALHFGAESFCTARSLATCHGLPFPRRLSVSRRCSALRSPWATNLTRPPC